jgi:hypothetical protein
MEAINYEISEEEKIWCNANSSTIASDQFEFEGTEDSVDRYTYTPPRSGDRRLLISCNLRNDRPDKDRTCQVRHLLWRGSSTGGVSELYYPNFVVFESADDQWFTNACENIASLGGLWPELMEQFETIVSEFRGVYSPNYERKVIFSETITFKTSELPRWKPNSIIGKQNIEEDYA